MLLALLFHHSYSHYSHYSLGRSFAHSIVRGAGFHLGWLLIDHLGTAAIVGLVAIAAVLFVLSRLVRR